MQKQQAPTQLDTSEADHLLAQQKVHQHAEKVADKILESEFASAEDLQKLSEQQAAEQVIPEVIERHDEYRYPKGFSISKAIETYA